MESATKKAINSAKEPRPYNRYNIYFILERERLVVSLGGETKWTKMRDDPGAKPDPVKPGYEDLNLPPLPGRFSHLFVPEGWCVSGPKKRKHRKMHGVASFEDIAESISLSWKTIDEETSDWCSAVEKVRSIANFASRCILSLPTDPHEHFTAV